MIFDKDYDASLWCIVKADRKNRKEIMDFINEIPEELLENIRISIEKLKKGEFIFDGETSDFYRCISKKQPRIFYYFQLDEDECLTIIKSYYDGYNEDELFELEINPIKPEYFIKIGMFEEEYIGTLTNNIQTTHFDNKYGLIDCTENEYTLYKTPIGHFIAYGKEIPNSEKVVTMIKPISLKRMPEDISKDNILCRRLIPRRNNKK